MNIKKIVLVILISLFLSSCSNATDVRQPVVAGLFYPNNPDTLKTMIDEFLNDASDKMIEDELVALIVPHAGYMYSGPVAAYAFKHLKDRSFDTVIIIGPSHQAYFDGISVDNRDAYLTPLGEAKIDKTLANKIISKNKKIKFYPQAHKEEHSVEVEIPFLQTVMKDFKIIPIVMGIPSMENCEILANALAKP